MRLLHTLRLSYQQRKLIAAYAFVAPAVAYFCFLFIYPLLRALLLSFTRWSIAGPPEFIGAENYLHLFRDQAFLHSLLVTCYYASGVVVVSLLLSLPLAVMLQRRLLLMGVLRASYLIPQVVPLLVVGVVWNYAFNVSYGFVNEFMAALGLGRIAWLNDVDLAMPALIVVGVWRMLGFDIVLFLAGLQGIPQELYEAAEIDGASVWHKFWLLTVPLLRPTTTMVLIVSGISNLQSFDLVYSLTMGGPINATRVAMLTVYETGFRYQHMGYALAQAMVLFVLMFGISLLQLKVFRGYSHE